LNLGDTFTVLQYALGFVLILGALIFIHEFGHFVVAKLFGIRVETFSLGFGPRVLGFQRGATRYQVAAIPLGGYVKMLGENPDEELRGGPEEFLSRSKPVRFAVLVMGAGMNLLLAVGIFWGMFLVGVQEYAYLDEPAVVGSVQPGSPAAEAGLQPGDEILAVGDHPAPSWQEFSTHVQIQPDTATTLRVRRAGEERTLSIHIGIPPVEDPRERYGMGYVGVRPYVPRFAAQIEPGSPAERGGLRDGDELWSVAGARAWEFSTFREAEEAGIGLPLPITVMREGREIALALVPADVDGKGGIGAAWLGKVTLKRYPPLGALKASLETNWESAGLLFRTLRNLKIFGGSIGVRAMSGPVDIARFSGEALRAGWRSFVALMAMISLQLGILNLLPIPVLDGGHIFVLLLEGVLRRDFSMQVKERLIQVGFLFLITLMGVVISIDLIKNFVS
jgi:regulator of sigma E protease